MHAYVIYVLSQDGMDLLFDTVSPKSIQVECAHVKREIDERQLNTQLVSKLQYDKKNVR